jgi:hypothetical protein
MVTQSPALSRMQGASKRDLAVHLFARTLWLPLAFGLGACSTFDFDSFRPPDLSIMTPRATAALREKALPAVTAEDLVSTDGQCAGVVTGPDPNIPVDQQQPNAPMLPSAIALDMTECDVVKRAGQPEKLDFRTSEGGERTAVLTYVHGPRPGIYTFTAGRLTSIERAPDPPAPAKPARQQRRRTGA